MDAQLIVVDGPATKKKITLQLPIEVGRAENAGLTIAHGTVSRRHCELFDRDGLVMVSDLGSTNGTWVDGVQVNEAILRPGDRLTIGPLTFEIQYQSAATAATPSATEPSAAIATVAAEAPAAEPQPLESAAKPTDQPALAAPSVGSDDDLFPPLDAEPIELDELESGDEVHLEPTGSSEPAAPVEPPTGELMSGEADLEIPLDTLDEPSQSLESASEFSRGEPLFEGLGDESSELKFEDGEFPELDNLSLDDELQLELNLVDAEPMVEPQLATETPPTELPEINLADAPALELPDEAPSAAAESLVDSDNLLENPLEIDLVSDSDWPIEGVPAGSVEPGQPGAEDDLFAGLSDEVEIEPELDLSEPGSDSTFDSVGIREAMTPPPRAAEPAERSIGESSLPTEPEMEAAPQSPPEEPVADDALAPSEAIDDLDELDFLGELDEAEPVEFPDDSQDASSEPWAPVPELAGGQAPPQPSAEPESTADDFFDDLFGTEDTEPGEAPTSEVTSKAADVAPLGEALELGLPVDELPPEVDFLSTTDLTTVGQLSPEAEPPLAAMPETDELPPELAEAEVVDLFDLEAADEPVAIEPDAFASDEFPPPLDTADAAGQSGATDEDWLDDLFEGGTPSPDASHQAAAAKVPPPGDSGPVLAEAELVPPEAVETPAVLEPSEGNLASEANLGMVDPLEAEDESDDWLGGIDESTPATDLAQLSAQISPADESIDFDPLAAEEPAEAEALPADQADLIHLDVEEAVEVDLELPEPTITARPSIEVEELDIDSPPVEIVDASPDDDELFADLEPVEQGPEAGSAPYAEAPAAEPAKAEGENGFTLPVPPQAPPERPASAAPKRSWWKRGGKPADSPADRAAPSESPPQERRARALPPLAPSGEQPAPVQAEAPPRRRFFGLLGGGSAKAKPIPVYAPRPPIGNLPGAPPTSSESSANSPPAAGQPSQAAAGKKSGWFGRGKAKAAASPASNGAQLAVPPEPNSTELPLEQPVEEPSPASIDGLDFGDLEAIEPQAGHESESDSAGGEPGASTPAKRGPAGASDDDFEAFLKGLE